MPINTILNLKTRFERKKAYKISETYFLLWCNVLPSARFAQLIFFQAPSSILVSVTFTEVLMKDLARMLIHVRKILNCRVSFKMLLSMCLVIIEKGL